MSNETHPNAFRLEAKDKRDQANALLAEAKQLEDRAEALETERYDKQLDSTSPSPVSETQTERQEENDDKQNEASQDKKRFSKK